MVGYRSQRTLYSPEYCHLIGRNNGVPRSCPKQVWVYPAAAISSQTLYVDSSTVPLGKLPRRGTLPNCAIYETSGRRPATVHSFLSLLCTAYWLQSGTDPNLLERTERTTPTPNVFVLLHPITPTPSASIVHENV